MNGWRKRTGGGHAFALVEILVAIAALAAVSIVVMQLFVKAAAWEDRARDLDMACFEVQGLVETVRHTALAPDDSVSGWNRIVTRVTPNEWRIFYDSEWHTVDGAPERGFVMYVLFKPPEADEGAYLSVTVDRIDPAMDETADRTIYALQGVACGEEAPV